MQRITSATVMAAIILAILQGCGTQKKAGSLKKNAMAASISITEESVVPEIDTGNMKHDTLQVEDPDGNMITIMKAVKDENGEMVATDVIDAAVVTARFKNVAERFGKVDISFQVKVPAQMQDGRWQLRFNPDMYLLEDSIRLDPVIITGNDYRRAQLRGYQQYERFLRSIITDTTEFIDTYQLEIFLRRNLPTIYEFRKDTSFVSDQEFASAYGVTEQDAVRHFANRLRIRRNDRRIKGKDMMFKKLVKVPIVTEGLRLDTVITSVNGDFIYEYTQTINTRPSLRKVDIVLSGDIYEGDRKIYEVPRSEPLTFYISSLSTLADRSGRYLTRIVERDVETNTACYIDFKSASSEIEQDYGNNPWEIGRIKKNLDQLIDNGTFVLDSIIVTASCSPEGSWEYNGKLSQRRAEAVSRYFTEYLKFRRDSIKRTYFTLGIDGMPGPDSDNCSDIRFISRNNPENWNLLDNLVSRDTTLAAEEKEEYSSLSGLEPDEREHGLGKMGFYPYLREHLYPRLRTVRFDFHLHRRGMIKDTVHTTVLDTAYMSGVQALVDHDYERAVTLLRPYGDYNTAVAYCAMDYNASAMDILKNLPEDGRVDYIMAILYARKGDYKNSVEKYLKAVKSDRSYVYRGNLDPEISAVIKRYGLNTDQQ